MYKYCENSVIWSTVYIIRMEAICYQISEYKPKGLNLNAPLAKRWYIGYYTFIISVSQAHGVNSIIEILLIIKQRAAPNAVECDEKANDD